MNICIDSSVDKKIIEFDLIKQNIDVPSVLNKTIKEIEEILDIDAIIILAIAKNTKDLVYSRGLSHNDGILTICRCLSDTEMDRYKKKITDPFLAKAEIKKITKDLKINLNAKGVIIVPVNTMKKYYTSFSCGFSRREQILVFINALASLSNARDAEK